MSKLIKKPSYQAKLQSFRSGGQVRRYQVGGQFSGQERYYNFSGPMYSALYDSWKRVGKVPHEQAVRLARLGTYQAAQESGYGSHKYSKNYNYGNMVDGKGGYQTFKSMQDYADAFVSNMGKHFPKARNAKDFDSYMNSIQTGDYIYAESPTYVQDVRGTVKRVDKNIDQWLQANPTPKPTPKPTQQKPTSQPKKSWWQIMMQPMINDPIFYSK